MLTMDTSLPLSLSTFLPVPDPTPSSGNTDPLGPSVKPQKIDTSKLRTCMPIPSASESTCITQT